MCDPFNPFGGGKKSEQSSSQTATNTTSSSTASTVTVNVPITTDTTPLAAAIDAMRGQGSATALATAAILATAIKSNSQVLASAVQSSSGGSSNLQIVIAVLGLVGALIVAHVIKLRPLDLD